MSGEIVATVEFAADPTQAAIRTYKAAMREDRCAYCSSATSGTLDHIDARKRGGGNRWENLTGICSCCNFKKKDLSVLGHLGRQRLRPAYLAMLADYSAWGGV